MLDLLGYWVSVSIIIVVVLMPVFLGLMIVAYHYVKRIFDGDEEKAEKWFSSLLDIDSNEGITFRGKTVIHPALFLFSLVAGPVAHLIFTLETFLDVDGYTYSEIAIRFINTVSEFTAPAVGYIIIPVVLYYGSAVLVKRAIKLKMKLDNIYSKLKE